MVNSVLQPLFLNVTVMKRRKKKRFNPIHRMQDNIIITLAGKGVNIVKGRYVGLAVRHSLTAISGWFALAWQSTSTKLKDVAEQTDLDTVNASAAQIVESLQSDQFTNGVIAFASAAVGILWSVIEKRLKFRQEKDVG